MILDTITNKNDEWYTPEYAVLPILEFLKPESRIWCPFDTSDSEYVKVLRAYGHTVISTHIKNQQDFFMLQPKGGFQYIISNPPYSVKGEVLQRLYDLKIPFMMLMGCVGIFESQKRFDMFKENDVELLIFNKRIDFIGVDKTKNAPPFSSWYICKNVLPSKIEFRNIHKPKHKKGEKYEK